MTTHNNIKDFPDFIKIFLDSLSSGNFSIANPNENFKAGCTSLTIRNEKGNIISLDENLPNRQLIYFGLGKDIALMTYYTGGIGKSEHILILKYKGKSIIDFWCGNVLVDLKTKDEVLKFLKTNKDKEWGLNTNIIYI